MIRLNNYNNFLKESDNIEDTNVEQKESTSIDDLFQKLKERLLNRHKKPNEVETTKETETTQDENYYEGTIKNDVDNIKKELDNKSDDELNEYSIKCANLISQTQKRIHRLKSKINTNDESLNSKLDIYNKNIKLLKDLKVYIDKKYIK